MVVILVCWFMVGVSRARVAVIVVAVIVVTVIIVAVILV